MKTGFLGHPLPGNDAERPRGETAQWPKPKTSRRCWRGFAQATASFALPAGPEGRWHAELVTLDGRVLGESTLTGAAGTRVSIAVGRAPANAVSLLRLTAPDGAQRFVPIVR